MKTRKEAETRIIKRNDERNRILKQGLKANAFFEKKTGKIDVEKLITKALKEGFNVAQTFTTTAQYFSDPTCIEHQKLLSIVYPYFNQTRSFKTRFISHFSVDQKGGDPLKRLLRRPVYDISDCLID